jgi:hypothetical protein
LPIRVRIDFRMPMQGPSPIDTIDPVYATPSKVALTGIRPPPPSASTTFGGTATSAPPRPVPLDLIAASNVSMRRTVVTPGGPCGVEYSGTPTGCEHYCG